MLFWIITTASNVVIQNFDLHTLKQKQVLTNLPLLFYCRLPTAIGRPLPIADSNSKTQQNAMYIWDQHYFVFQQQFVPSSVMDLLSFHDIDNEAKYPSLESIKRCFLLFSQGEMQHFWLLLTYKYNVVDPAI